MNYFIVNPNSRSGKGHKIWKTILEELNKTDIKYKVYFTSTEYNGTYIAKQITKNNSTCSITAIGGDGTVNEVINGINNFDNVTFSYIPTGSSNDFARGLSLSQNPKECLNMILNSNTTEEINIGCVKNNNHKRYFAVSCGIGFNGEVSFDALNSKIKGFLNKFKLGKLCYLFIALKRLILTKPVDMKISVDNGKFKIYNKVLLLACMNLPYEGGGFKFCPQASCSDNLLDVCIVHNISKLKILMLLPTAFKGSHINITGVSMIKCKSIKIRTTHKKAVHTDGESFDYNNNVHISCHKSRLKFITNNYNSLVEEELV